MHIMHGNVYVWHPHSLFWPIPAQMTFILSTTGLWSYWNAFILLVPCSSESFFFF